MNLIRKFRERFISQIWSESKALRIFVKTLNAVAIFALVAWIALSVIAHYRTDTAQVVFENTITQKTNTPKTFTYRAKLRFSNPLFRYQRNITHIEITQILWSESIDKSAISEVKNAHDRIFDFTTTQDLDTLKSAELGFAEYKSDFMPLLKTIIFYYILLILIAFVLTILWRNNRTFVKSTLVLVVFSLVILTIDGAKIERLNLVPFGIIGICVFGLCVFFAFRAKSTKAKLFLAYFSVVPLCLGIAEFWLFLQDRKSQIPHKILGFANTLLYDSKAKFVVDDKIIYDVHYKHDEFGNRITPNNNMNSKKCIAIYGGSFAYGAAVDSDKTLEYFLTKNLPQYKILNFGINGAGAHTALARLEFQIDKRTLDKCEEFIAIYEAIPHHIYRAYGVYLGPHYRIDSQGVLRYFGTYKGGEYNHARFYQKNPPKIIPQPQEAVSIANALKKFHNAFKDIVRLQGKFDKSYIKQSFTLKTNSLKSKDMIQWTIYEAGYMSNPNYYKIPTNEINLYFVIVKKMQEELQMQYGVPLYIVLWDYDMQAQFLDKYDEVLKANFRQMKVPFYTLSEMIADYPQDLERVKRGDFDNFKYRVSRWDTHPNALANEKIAEFLAQKIKNGEIKSHKVKGIK
ncbi:hypothetical protein [Helicobacter sp. T3_23-1056]